MSLDWTQQAVSYLVRAIANEKAYSQTDAATAELDRRERAVMDRIKQLEKYVADMPGERAIEKHLAELDRRLPVPGESEEDARCETCNHLRVNHFNPRGSHCRVCGCRDFKSPRAEATGKELCGAANDLNSRTCVLWKGHSCHHLSEGLSWTDEHIPKQSAPAAESWWHCSKHKTSGKYGSCTECTIEAGIKSAKEEPLVDLGSFAPAAPTDGYVELGSLKPGDVFKTKNNGLIGRIYESADGESLQYALVGSKGKHNARYAHIQVRRLTILKPGERVLGADEFAVRDDEATIERVEAVINKESFAKMWDPAEVAEFAREILAALKSATKETK